MSLPRIASHEEWLTARKALLEKEKALTRARDELNTERRELPMVEITKDYRFEGPDGDVGLLDLFEGRRQLMIGHFMFDPEWDDGCPSCTAGADEVADGFLDHLATRDTTLAYVSRAPLAKIEDYKSRKGWTFPWYSSFGSDFNYDFGVTLDAGKAPSSTTSAPLRSTPSGASRASRVGPPFEMPGLSASCGTTDTVFHTYSRTPAAPRRPAAPTTSST